MKKVFFFAALLCSVALFAETELVDFSKITLDSWGLNGNPDVTLDAGKQEIKVVIKAAGGDQWMNQAKITLDNVKTLDLNKEYQLSFTAVSTSDNCTGVTVKFFDNNILSFSGKWCTETERVHSEGCLSLNTTPLNYQSEWIQPESAATNGMIVIDFGWDPAQTVTISKLSFKERAAATAIDNINAHAAATKTIEYGQLVIIKNGVRYNVAGQEVK